MDVLSVIAAWIGAVTGAAALCWQVHREVQTHQRTKTERIVVELERIGGDVLVAVGWRGPAPHTVYDARLRLASPKGAILAGAESYWQNDRAPGFVMMPFLAWRADNRRAPALRLELATNEDDPTTAWGRAMVLELPGPEHPFKVSISVRDRASGGVIARRKLSVKLKHG